ncbi:MAG: RidA family protein [Candidatus Solibacter sp.]|nr:RidA family protein [Candidatus Solibacter sp.]
MIPAHAQAPLTATRNRSSTIRRSALLASACCLLLASGLAAQKKARPKKEEITQTLQLPRELPGAVIGETRRLTFHVTPLSTRGLLSAQVRDALKALTRETGGNPVLKIRAFVAGSGDLRRVRDLVSEVFTDRRLPLPALSLIQSGGLPLEGAQVVLEAIAAGKKEVSPHGLVFLSAPIATSDNPLDPVAPLAAQSLDSLKRAIKTAGSEPSDVVRVTCFLSSLDHLAATRKLVEADFPRAALNYVQTQRSPSRALAACEAVARLRWNTGKPVQFQPEAGEPLAALVGAPRVVLTGTQVSYGYQEANSRLAFGRLQKVLEATGVSGRDVAFAHYYPLADLLAAQVRILRTEFFAASAGSLVLFEGLPGMDAGFAVDVVAVKD